jgi:hypothetical protein
MSGRSRVLVVPAGTDNGYEAWESLRGRYEVLCADTARLNPTSLVSGGFEKMPPGFGPDFWAELRLCCARRGVDLIVPTHDGILVGLAEAGLLGGARGLVSSVLACRTTARKDTTYEALRDGGLEEFCPARAGRFPMFIRPNVGRGSQDAMRVEDQEHLDLLLRLIPDAIVTEFLPGREYTVDCLSGMDGTLIGLCARERIYISHGITKIGVTVNDPRLDRMADAVSGCIKPSGPWFFQAKEDARGVPKLMEVNLRVGGMSGLSRLAGFNHLLMGVEMFLGREIGAVGPPREGVCVSRGPALIPAWSFGDLDCVIWDLDDTLWSGRFCPCEASPHVFPEVAATIGFLAARGVPMALVTSNRLLASLGRGGVLSILSKAGVHYPFFPVLFSGSGKVEAVGLVLRTLGVEACRTAFVDDSYGNRLQVVEAFPSIVALDPSAHSLLLGGVRYATSMSDS